MARGKGQPLQGAPEVGQTLEFDGRRWTVSDHSSSWSESDSYSVDEWECEAPGSEDLAYLLREGGEPPRWFFTRSIPTSSVTVGRGKPLAKWLKTTASPPPPERLTYRGQDYLHDDTTEQTYQEELSKIEAKTTWEYWDAARRWNLAVERWADGRVQCYHGRYVELADITIAPGASLASVMRGQGRVGGTPGAIILALGLFVFLLIAGVAVDSSLSVALGLLGLILFIHALRSAALVAPWLLGTAVLALVSFRFPPLTSPAGLAAVVLVPAVVTRWCGMRSGEATREHGAWTAGVSAAVAVLPSAVYHYVSFAPVPHSIGQYLLALGPAAFAGLAAMLVAWLVLRMPGATR